MLAGEHSPGAAKADRHLVGDQQNIILPSQRSNARQETGGMNNHAARPLHDRLQANSGHACDVLDENRSKAFRHSRFTRPGSSGDWL